MLELVTSPKRAKDAIDDKELSDGPLFPGDKFFTEWFRKRGTIYSFLFKKNLRVTNIQVAELIALLRSYRLDSGRDLAFRSVEGYKDFLVHVAQSLKVVLAEGNTKSRALQSKYGDLICDAAVIDVMYGSCVVYLPPGVVIDLKAVCSQSGYIHSCGRNVYIRNVYKAAKNEFFANLEGYLGERYAGKRVFFRPYSNEDFTDFDRKQRESLKFGLDDVKLSVQKYFLGEDRIADVIEEMRSVFQGRLEIPGPGDYHNDFRLLNGLRRSSDFAHRNALFLIMDHSTRLNEQPQGNTQLRGNRHFIICYDQEFINENPFHLFDEDKPAWFDHTTLPHTLAGAMINISRPFWPRRSGPLFVCDCFVGSGTTLLEASKCDDIICSGLDYEPISPLLIEDNVHFFSLSVEKLREYEGLVLEVANYLVSSDDSPAYARQWDLSEPGMAFGEARKLFSRWLERRTKSPESTPALVKSLREVSPFVRLLFYTQLKGARRYEAAITSGSYTIDKALHQELGTLQEELKQLVGLRQRTESGESDGRRMIFQGAYSESLSIAEAALKSLSNQLLKRVKSKNCLKWRPRTEFDLIVTDPPYGFNTTEDPEALAEIYCTFLRTAVKSLKDGGQLVLALPDWSHTGRRLPAFILKDFITHQVVTIAEQEGREIITSAEQITKTVPVAPYYWESERALRRAILHFRFRKRPEYRRDSQAPPRELTSGPGGLTLQ
ncbi:hypothetical protein [Occallatibacter savannae]|uniref:hypothetical protein n=1 Tax=Occallatibacter savannae TaxID=1002691 RepID=UPI001EF70ADB|nr:hypothetical protein [Occallatibacter savannae]